MNIFFKVFLYLHLIYLVTLVAFKIEFQLQQDFTTVSIVSIVCSCVRVPVCVYVYVCVCVYSLRKSSLCRQDFALYKYFNYSFVYYLLFSAGVPVSVYRPAEVSKVPTILVYFHGGGLVIGSRNSHATVLKTLARSVEQCSRLARSVEQCSRLARSVEQCAGRWPGQ